LIENVPCTIEQKIKTFYEIHIAFRLALIHSSCSSSLQSDFKLPTQTHQLHYLVSRTLLFHTITSYTKTSVLLKLSNVTFPEFFTSPAIIYNIGKSS